MRALLPTLLLGSTFLASVHAAEPLSPVAQATVLVTTAAGKLRGQRSGDIEVFKGIEYAAPPVGPLRWRPPQPVGRWHGVRDALRYGDDCLQNRFEYDSTPSHQPMSEDCLNLNVWVLRPAINPAG